MRDFATSDSPAVQTQLDRLAALSLPQGRFGLETIRALLARLGDPQKAIPPAFHVAGTNGKGSTCAFLRAMLEAQGLTVHAATSPHLVRYNERIRIAGALISDALLAALLAEALDAGEDLGPSFFEVTAAATFLAFARNPADACVIEVGLGGRFDATNVLGDPAACGIASLGIDHEAFLLAPEDGTPADPLARIAFEKAGIARPGRPLVTQSYAPAPRQALGESAAAAGALLAVRGEHWRADLGETIAYADARGSITLPLPTLAGTHQADNAALAVAMLRHQDRVTVSPEAMAAGIRAARWPARMQLLGEGPLTALVRGRRVWLDGGHNPDAGAAIARFLGAGVARRASTSSARAGLGFGTPTTGSGTTPAPPEPDTTPARPEPHTVSTQPKLTTTPAQPEPVEGRAQPFHLIIGMLANKNPAAIVAPLADRLLSLSVVPIPGHESHTPEAFAPFTDLPIGAFTSAEAALSALPPGGDVLIAGSLYLAGEMLRLNRQAPD